MVETSCLENSQSLYGSRVRIPPSPNWDFEQSKILNNASTGVFCAVRNDKLSQFVLYSHIMRVFLFSFENLIATMNKADFIAQSKNKVDLNFYKVLPDETSFLVAWISYLKNKDSWNYNYLVTGFFEKKIPNWKDYKEYIEEYANKKNLQLK